MCILEAHSPKSWESRQILRRDPLPARLLGPGANLLSDHNCSLRILTPPATPGPKESGLADFLLCGRWHRWVHAFAQLSFWTPLTTFNMSSVQPQNAGASHMLGLYVTER